MENIAQYKDIPQYKKVVGIGGGNTLPEIMRVSQHYYEQEELGAITTANDNGKNTRKWREICGTIGPGDYRRVLEVFADQNKLWIQAGAMSHVFKNDDKFGNILIGMMFEKYKGREEHALHALNQMLGVRADVCPITFDQSEVRSLFSGPSIELSTGGETAIDTRPKSDTRDIDLVILDPPAYINVPSRRLLKKATRILFTYGDVFTSQSQIFRVRGFREMFENKETTAEVGVIVNIMTKPEETRGWPASKFVSTFAKAIGRSHLDFALVNTGDIPLTVAQMYKEGHAEPVFVDKKELESLCPRIIYGDFVKKDSTLARHDAHEVVRTLITTLGR